MTFLFLVFFLGSLWRGSFGSWLVLSVSFWEIVNFSSLLCPLSFRAMLYGFVASPNNLESEELLGSLNSIPFGRLFMIAGGWLFFMYIVDAVIRLFVGFVVSYSEV